jgi:hypothetical protein
MTRFVSVVLVMTALSSAAQAQDHPQILLITRERIKPGAEAEFAQLEEAMAASCARLGCPHRWLATRSLTGAADVWWFNVFASDADRERVTKAFEANPPLMAALNELAVRKRRLAEPPVDVVGAFQPGLSSGARWRVGHDRFVVVQVTRAGHAMPGSVFVTADGITVVVVSTGHREEADRLAAIAGHETRVFEVRPTWSMPSDAWVAANPELWKR